MSETIRQRYKAKIDSNISYKSEILYSVRTECSEHNIEKYTPHSEGTITRKEQKCQTYRKIMDCGTT